jgi:hypothetical protein
MILTFLIFFLSIFLERERNGTTFLLSINLIATQRFSSSCQNSSVGKEIFFSNSGKTSLFLSLSFSLSNSFSHCPNLSNLYVSIENTRSLRRHMSMIRIKCFTLRSLRTHLVGSRRFELYAHKSLQESINNTLTYKQRVFFISQREKNGFCT